MTREQAYILRKFVDDAGSGLLYMTIQRLDGTKPNYGWVDISGRPDLSDIEPNGPMQFWGGHTHKNVTLTLNNITIVSESPVF